MDENVLGYFAILHYMAVNELDPNEPSDVADAISEIAEDQEIEWNEEKVTESVNNFYAIQLQVQEALDND